MATEWNAEEALASLTDEGRILDDGDNVSTAKRIFRENAGVAAAAIIHVAKYSPSDRTRFEAAKYVVERNLGRIGDEGAEEDPLESFMGMVVKDEEENIVKARSVLGSSELDGEADESEES